MRSHTAHSKRQHGFTLIEGLITVAVSIILATTAVPSMARWLDQQRLQGAAQQLLGDLQFIRSEAVARQQGLRLTVLPWAGGSCYVLHSGSANACTCGPLENTPAVCSGGATEVKTVRWTAQDKAALQSSANSLRFDPWDGTSTPTATLNLTNPQGQQLRHVVNVMGRVRTCSPGGSVPGHVQC
ncbi:MAG: fimbrial assembly protein [Rhizobacter sp.]